MNRLELIKEWDRELSPKDDEFALKTLYDRDYKNKLDFDNFREQMLAPLTPAQQNEMARRRALARETLTSDDLTEYYHKKKIKEYEAKGEIGFWEGLGENNPSDFIPFLGDAVSGIEAMKHRKNY
jgi:hypothetical protein